MINFLDCCYRSGSLKEAIELLSEEARKTGLVEDLNHAMLMKQYYALVNKQGYKNRMMYLINKISEEVMNKRFRYVAGWIDYRIKTAYSTDTKILLLQEEAKAEIAAGRRPREEFPRDVFACRITVKDHNDLESVGECFNIMNEVLEFLVSQMGCILELSTGTVKTSKFKPEEHPDVILPTEEMVIWDKFKPFVKNYFSAPKGNGYQSLHACIRDVQRNFVFEIQITTETAHKRVNVSDDASEVNEDSLQTSHNWHKHKKYGRIYEMQGMFDPSRVHMEGFYYNPETGKFVDTIGLVEAEKPITRRN